MATRKSIVCALTVKSGERLPFPRKICGILRSAVPGANPPSPVMLENPDTLFMKAALLEAEKAFADDEVPVGAVVVSRNRIIARAHNQTERLRDSTAHAEMLALTAAEETLGSKILETCTLYVTLEPCVMCAGACFWTRIGRVVVAAADPKVGFLRFGTALLHPRTEYYQGVEADAAADLLRRYFQAKRS